MSPSKVSREMLIVTGMSGAGRSTVGNALEDLGWYVVDNLPPQMLKPLVDLAGHTGLEDQVKQYVLSQDGAGEFIDAYVAALAPVLAGYRRENKRHATIALGCTGGKHRSVAIAEELGRRLSALPGLNVSVKHRDLGRE